MKPRVFLSNQWGKLEGVRGLEKYYLRWNVSYSDALNRLEFEGNADTGIHDINVFTDSCRPISEVSSLYENLYIENVS